MQTGTEIHKEKLLKEKQQEIKMMICQERL